jgi:uncharacterized membrane protein YsdA (DUF1294 family)/cold shock CspA family protein
MNEAGELIEWNDERGFGFVQPREGPKLFVHISAFERPMRRPELGDRLAFTRGPGKDGRPAVVVAQIAGATRRPAPLGPSAERLESAQLARALRLLGAALLLVALIALHLPRFTMWIYLAMGAVSFAAYWLDKRAASAGAWRTSEATLHAIDLFGGIVGGLLAQTALHHKTAKPGFAFATFGIAFCHLLLLIGIAIGPIDLPAGLR